MTVANSLAYYDRATITNIHICITQVPGVCVIKRFTMSITTPVLFTGACVVVTCFHSSLIFERKVGAYPRRGSIFHCLAHKHWTRGRGLLWRTQLGYNFGDKKFNSYRFLMTDWDFFIKTGLNWILPYIIIIM
jgi:hypothetical protein